MQRQHLLDADILSEVILLVTGAALFVALVLVLLAVSAGAVYSFAG
jgi:hypothetical protein